MSTQNDRWNAPDDVLEAAPGWYGKLPSMGDFVVRRLPQQFTARWDSWLVAGLNSSRVVLGDQWLACYLNAPVWCFGLMAGLVDEHSWFGVMMPSVDRVGRYFPLTVASAIPRPGSIEEARSLQEWLSRLQSVVLTVLSEDSSLDGFEQQLVALAPPNAREPRVEEGSDTGRWPMEPDGIADTLASAALAGFWRGMRGSSLWWSADRPTLIRHPGLPPTGEFHTLLAPLSG